MNYEEFVLHWNYFCSLAIRLEETKNYVYHGIVESDGFRLIHADVCSDVFKQIIILAASEFENVAKTICKCFGEKPRSIEGISRFILNKFPRIIETEVITLFWQGRPLSDWKIDENDKKKKVHGIEWWDAYNSLKHNKVGSYKQATLNNAVMSLSIKNMALFKKIDETLLDMRYLIWFLRIVQADMKQKASASVQSFVSLSVLRNYPLPLPPVSEQRRIIERIEEVMPMCEDLK